MPLHTLKPAAEYLPKLGKKATQLLAAEITAEMTPDQQAAVVRAAWKASVTNHARDGLAKDITAQLGEIVEEHEMLFGDRDASTDPVEWDSGLDDAIQEGFDLAFWAGVGASGQVEHTTDTEAHKPERRTELGQRIAGEIIANGEWLILSDAEVTAILVANPPKAAAAETPANATPVVGTAEHPQTGISYASAWDMGVRLVRAALAKGTHDVLTITDELELCIDSDDILGTAGAQRLAPDATPEVVRAGMQILAGKATEDGSAWTEALVMAALHDETPAQEQSVAETAKADAAARTAGENIDGSTRRETVERKTPAEQSASAVHAQEVMMRLLGLSGMAEQAMADILGCSRGMVNAATKGRKNIDWTPDRVAALKQASMEFATNVATFQDEAGDM